MTNNFQPGDRVQYVGNPNLGMRNLAFSAFKNRVFTVLEGTSYRNDGDHQYHVNLGRDGAYFFGSELKKIEE